MNSAMNLRDTLLAALARLPGTREFHLHVLVTGRRKDNSLYPFAKPRPRTYLQDILVLLSEERAGEGGRKFVTGLEAHVYTVPSTDSGILYISKVDTTGQAGTPSPTYTLVRAFMGYFGDPGTGAVGVKNLWVHLFARAQGQYLFPNSAEYVGKRPLSDVKLCGWWKRMFGDVEEEIRNKGTATMTRLYYVLPGYGEAEAVQLLMGDGSAAKTSEWKYGHPYSQKEIGLPCGGEGSLGHYIPSFEDDPKTRFLEELALTGTGRKRKRGETEGELGKVGAEEFWERMSFRQECVSGAVTGFFALGIRCEDVAGQDVAEQTGAVPVQVEQRILAGLRSHEFSTAEHTARGTALVEGTIRGLCGEGVSGEVRVANGGLETGRREAGTVRRLTARKKQ